MDTEMDDLHDEGDIQQLDDDPEGAQDQEPDSADDNENELAHTATRPQRGDKRRDEFADVTDEQLAILEDFTAAAAELETKQRTFTDEEVQTDTAMLVGLNAMQVEEEEAEMLPANVKHTNYIKVRNHVLTRWRADVTRYLTVEEAQTMIKKAHHPLVELAWRYLNTYGWINWGVAPAVMREPDVEHQSVDQPAVIIVGAGLAGAAAARQLTKWGWRVVVLESRDRPGGRVWSYPMEGGGLAGAADLGGAIITGIHGNPLAVLAQQLNLPLHNIRDTCPLYLHDGQLAPKDLDDQVHAQHNALLDQAHDFREELPTEVADCLSVGAAMRMLWAGVPREPGCEDLQERLMQWHFRNVEFANAAKLNTLSLRGWDQDDPHEMLGPHVLLPGGNVQLVEALLQEVPVMYGSAVQHVKHGPSGVTVTTADGTTLTADAALVTVPLGVLKRGSLTFTPPLPKSKQASIRRLGFGVLNKLVLLFPEPFWGDDLDLLAHVAEDPKETGFFYLFYAYRPQLVGSGAVLAALISGEAAERFESMSVDEALGRVMAVLRTIHEPRGIAVPDPLDVVATHWASDPHAHGSYSSVAVGATGDDYDTMARDVGGRLFFAGEATIAYWPATMHGAFLSGMREAAKIRRTFEAPKKRRGGGGARRRAADELPLHEVAELSGSSSSSSSSEEESDGGTVAAHSSAGGRRADRRSRAALVPPEALRTAAALVQGGAALRTLFTEVEPDLEFGCFAAFHGPHGTPWHNQCLVQLDFRGMRTGPKKTVPLYLVLTAEQLSRVRNAPGGDEGRMACLVQLLGSQLLGRTPLGTSARDMLLALISARKLEHVLQPQGPDGTVNGDPAPATAATAQAAANGTSHHPTAPAGQPTVVANGQPSAHQNGGAVQVHKPPIHASAAGAGTAQVHSSDPPTDMAVDDWPGGSDAGAPGVHAGAGRAGDGGAANGVPGVSEGMGGGQFVAEPRVPLSTLPGYAGGIPGLTGAPGPAGSAPQPAGAAQEGAGGAAGAQGAAPGTAK